MQHEAIEAPGCLNKAFRSFLHHYFIFVHEDGAVLEQISGIFAQRYKESADEGFDLDDVNKGA